MADGDGSILDFLTNNWSSILGGNPASPAPQPPQWAMPASPQAPQASPTMATAQGVINPPPGVLSGQPFSSSGAVGPNPLTGGDPTTMASLNGGVLPAPAPGPGSPTPQMPEATLANMQPAPSGSPSQPNVTTDVSGGMPPRPPGAPLNITPDPNQFLPPNATSTMGGPPPSVVPPTSQTPQGLARLLGATPGGINKTTLQTSLAGLGAGLSAVGNLRPGANAGQAFAAGAGASLTGVDKAQNQLFAQSSTAFRDMMLAKAQDNSEGYRTAQANYLNARANSLKAGGTGSNAWQNTDYGKVIQVENEAQKYEKGQQILLQKRWTLNGSTPEQQQKDLDDLNTRTQAYRNKLYTSAGIDPNKGKQMKDWGTSAQNPFDTKSMSLDQFNSQVPMGAWFKDQNGIVRQRTVPPGGFGAGYQNGQPPQQQSSASTYDDMTAMQPEPQPAAA